MARNISADFHNAASDTVIYPAVLVELDFPSGSVYYWTGYGTLTYDSKDFLGLGYLASVSEIRETSDVVAEGISIGVNGIPGVMLSAVLVEAQQGQSVKVHLALLDSDGAVIDVAEDAFSGLMDVPSITKGSPESSIAIAVESRLIELQKSRERRYTYEDQKELYPTDESLRWVAGLQEKEITWGASSD